MASNGPPPPRNEKNAIKAEMNAFIAGLKGKTKNQAANAVVGLLDTLRPRIDKVLREANPAQKNALSREFDEKEKEVHTAIEDLPVGVPPPGGGPRRNRKQTGGRRRKSKRTTRKRKQTRKHK